MKSEKKPAYRFSISRMIYSVLCNIFANEWSGWVFVFLMWLLVVAVWMIFSQKYLNDFAFTPVINSLVYSVMFGTWGYPGYLSVKYRYFPSSISRPITGNQALVFGIFIILIGWGLTTYALYLTVSKLIEVISVNY